MGWRALVKVGGEWVRNSVVFATKSECEAHAKALAESWTAIHNVCVEETDSVPTHFLVNGRVGRIDDSNTPPGRNGMGRL